MELNFFKKGCQSTEPVPMIGGPESDVNDQNINMRWVILQQNWQVTYEKIAASTKTFENVVILHFTQQFSVSQFLFQIVHSSPLLKNKCKQ